MGVGNFDAVNSVYKDQIISAAEALMINCHHLASDLLDLAQDASEIEPAYAKTVSRQLSEWANLLANAVETIRAAAEASSAVSHCA